mgnify:CR=1 FL=1
MVIRRGDIWWANLAKPRGSEPGFRRPVLILQSDAINQSRVNTVIAATITTNLNVADARGNLYLGRDQSGLPKDSVVNVTQLLTIDKQHLVKRERRLSASVMENVDEGLRLVLFLR